jgi:hypothetical protein
VLLGEDLGRCHQRRQPEARGGAESQRIRPVDLGERIEDRTPQRRLADAGGSDRPA